MELSENTIQVLKNFAVIQPEIVFKPGNVVHTMSSAKNIVSRCTIDEEIPSEFGIGDLNQFLNVVSLVDGPRLKIEDNYCQVSDQSGMMRAKYFFSPPERLVHPKQQINMPDPETKFELSASTLQKLRRACGALGLEEMKVSVVNDVIQLAIVDPDNPTSHDFSVDVPGEFQSTDFQYIFNLNNVKVIPGDYDVEISGEIIASHFINKNDPIEYWIALESQSYYNGV